MTIHTERRGGNPSTIISNIWIILHRKPHGHAMRWIYSPLIFQCVHQWEGPKGIVDRDRIEPTTLIKRSFTTSPSQPLIIEVIRMHLLINIHTDDLLLYICNRLPKDVLFNIDIVFYAIKLSNHKLMSCI